MDWLDYREKLGIAFNDKKKIAYFKIKLFNALDVPSHLIESQISREEYRMFCDITGTPADNEVYRDGYERIMNILHFRPDSFFDFLAYYIAFINCQEDQNYKPFKRQHFFNLICRMLNEAHIPYEVFEDKDGYFIFPKGIPEFDSALVSQPLHWLSQYPNAEKAWSKALRAYSEATDENASEVADKFRKALETFFKEFFAKPDMSLEKGKSTYGTYLKSQGIPAEISNNFETLHSQYTQYMNHYAKHRDATSDKVLEYLMYQTGNIMRLLITLKQEETTNAD